MTASTRTREFIRSNIVGILALYVALGGSAYAAATVDSSDIEPNAVKAVHVSPTTFNEEITRPRGATNYGIAPNAVNGTEIADGSVGTNDLASSAVTATKISDAAFNSEIDRVGLSDPTLGIAPNAVDGDDVADSSLSGNDIGNGTLFGADILDNTLTGADIDESTLGHSTDIETWDDAREGVGAGGSQRISTADETTVGNDTVAPGNWFAIGEANILTDNNLRCLLRYGGTAFDVSDVQEGTRGAVVLSGAFSTATPVEVTMRCRDYNGDLESPYLVESTDLTMIAVDAIG